MTMGDIVPSWQSHSVSFGITKNTHADATQSKAASGISEGVQRPGSPEKKRAPRPRMQYQHNLAAFRPPPFQSPNAVLARQGAWPCAGPVSISMPNWE